MTENITYRPAEKSDTDAIVTFVDYWLSGGAIHDLAPGGGQDYFVPRARHVGFLKKHHVLIALDGNHIVGWAVTTPKNSLIHLLVAGDCRGQGVGQEMLRLLNPELVRSKIDQTTGDPTAFYLERGYQLTPQPIAGAKENIRLLEKKPEPDTIIKGDLNETPRTLSTDSQTRSSNNNQTGKPGILRCDHGPNHPNRRGRTIDHILPTA
ncbi:MAG: GNAT family N-acetyltransferase [Anaerolineae bacterium]|nr:GNAT family N-acetyltransferase [Anaerolineae bacterium]